MFAATSEAVLLAPLAAGVLDQDTPHGLGRRGEEVPPALPAPIVPRANQPKIRLVDQGGGLKRLAGTLLRHPTHCEPAELVVNQREQLVGGSDVAVIDSREDACHAVYRSWSPGVLMPATPAHGAAVLSEMTADLVDVVTR
jgi:hypothetical protein